jgi:hypothetical protein
MSRFRRDAESAGKRDGGRGAPVGVARLAGLIASPRPGGGIMNRSDMAVPVGPAARGERRPPRLPLRARRLVLVLHVISSVGWLGLNLGVLVLAVTGATTDDPQTQHAVYRVMGVLGDVLLLPISLTAFVTGLVLALGTVWGLFRHRWVVVKFWLTLIAVILTPLSLLPGIHETVAIVSSTPPDRLADMGGAAVDGISAGCVSTCMYVTCVVLSVFKPWGRTKGGRRKAAGGSVEATRRPVATR